MVPGHIVLLDRLPLTANGKVDRSALPAPGGHGGGEGPEQSGASSRTTPSADSQPALALEEKLTALWSRILHGGAAGNVGREENFFDLGGTSLQWIELHTELSKMLGRQLSMTELFEHPTIRSLAGWLAGNTHADPSFIKIQERARRQQEAFARQKRPKGTAL
jgi:acyl carrier protein